MGVVCGLGGVTFAFANPAAQPRHSQVQLKAPSVPAAAPAVAPPAGDGFGDDGTLVDPSAVGAAGGTQVLPGFNLPQGDSLAKLQALLANPWVQRYLKLYQDVKFQNALADVMKNPNRMNLLYAEMGLVFFLFIFRTWRSSKVKGFMGALWLKAWTFLLFVVLSSVVLPSFMLGDRYTEIINMIYRAFTTKV